MTDLLSEIKQCHKGNISTRAEKIYNLIKRSCDIEEIIVNFNDICIVIKEQYDDFTPIFKKLYDLGIVIKGFSDKGGDGKLRVWFIEVPIEYKGISYSPWEI